MTAKHHPYILCHFTSHTLRLLVKKDVLCVKGHGVSRIGTAMHAVGVRAVVLLLLWSECSSPWYLLHVDVHRKWGFVIAAQHCRPKVPTHIVLC